MAEGYEPQPLDQNLVVKTYGVAQADANAIFKSGIYRNVNSSITNTPNNNGNGILIVFQADGYCAMQLYIYSGGELYSRINWSAGGISWTTWTKAN